MDRMVVHNGSPLSSTFCAYVSFTMDPPCHPLVISFPADLTMNIYSECGRATRKEWNFMGCFDSAV